MPSGKQILIDELFKLSVQELPAEREASVSERVRAALLLHGSHTPDNMDCVSSLSYKKLSNHEHGPHEQQGIVLNKTGELLSDFISHLANIKAMPEELQAKYPALDTDDYWAALHAVVLILKALEWNSADAQAEQVTGDTEQLLQNSIAALQQHID